MVRAGETYKIDDVKVHIVEVLSYKKMSGRKELMIGYKIEDGDFVSPVAHFWMDEYDDIRRHLRRVVNYYKEVKNVLRR